ncbi:MAG: hypothetical protein IJT41_04465, partial [Clostridia bacterium]|nr:hypothetical protein [Clostridia bacterium]
MIALAIVSPTEILPYPYRELRRKTGGCDPPLRRTFFYQLPTNNYQLITKKSKDSSAGFPEQENPLFFSLFTDFCGIRKRPLVCHCERLYGARQSVLLLVHLCTAGVTDRRV